MQLRAPVGCNLCAHQFPATGKNNAGLVGEDLGVVLKWADMGEVKTTFGAKYIGKCHRGRHHTSIVSLIRHHIAKHYLSPT